MLGGITGENGLNARNFVQNAVLIYHKQCLQMFQQLNIATFATTIRTFREVKKKTCNLQQSETTFATKFPPSQHFAHFQFFTKCPPDMDLN